MRVRLVLSAITASAVISAVAHANQTPSIDVEAIMECRALAISHPRVADFRVASFGEESTQALREQADFAVILGVWGAPLSSVSKATRDMNAGERMFVEKTRMVVQLSNADTGPQGYSAELEDCVPIVWTAVKAVIDEMIQSGANRARTPRND